MLEIQNCLFEKIFFIKKSGNRGSIFDLNPNHKQSLWFISVF